MTIAILAVTVIAMTEPAPECRLVRPTWHTESGMFEKSSIWSMKRARIKVQEAAARAGADTIHVRRMYREEPGGLRTVLALAYDCRTEAAEEE